MDILQTLILVQELLQIRGSLLLVAGRRIDFSDGNPLFENVRSCSINIFTGALNLRLRLQRLDLVHVFQLPLGGPFLTHCKQSRSQQHDGHESAHGFSSLMEYSIRSQMVKWIDRLIIVFLFLFVAVAPHSIAATQTAWAMGMLLCLA